MTNAQQGGPTSGGAKLDAPTNEADFEALVDRGRIALQEGRLDEAKAVLEALRAAAPEDRDVLLFSAMIAGAEGDEQRALAAVDAAMDRYPDDLAVVVMKASLLLELMCAPAQALPFLEEAVSTLSEADAESEEDAAELEALYVELSLQLSEARGMVGDFDGSVEAAEAAIEVEDSPDARLVRARARLASGDVAGAKEDLERALPELEGDGDLHHLRARVALAEGDEAAADREFERAAEVEPGCFSVPPRVSRETFEGLVVKAKAALPEPFHGYLADVPIVIEGLPDLEQLRASEVPAPPGTPVLFEGPRRGPGDGEPLARKPERVHLYQRNVEALARDEAELEDVLVSSLVNGVEWFADLGEEGEAPRA